MSAQLSRVLIALSGILGTVLLGLYFGVGFSTGLAQLSSAATQTQVVSVATQYHTLWYLGTWLQATGSLLSVVFFLALVQKSGATARLAGLLTTVGSAVLLAVVLIEGVFTIDLAQAAANGHLETSLTSFDLMTVFTYIYPIVPALVIFLGLGTILLGSRLLPRVFGFWPGDCVCHRGIDRPVHHCHPQHRRAEPSGALGPRCRYHVARPRWDGI
jgi:hypothetical protein